MQGSPDLRAEVGNRSVKARRRATAVPRGNGGVTADYVPFYYAPRSPMMYAIHMGAVPEYSDGLEPLVYILSTPEAMTSQGCNCVITDGNCASAVTAFSDDLNDLDDLVDWDIMEQTYWANTNEDGDRRRRRSAEFLVHEHVPPAAIQAIATRSGPMLSAVDQIVQASGLEILTACKSDWYYT